MRRGQQFIYFLLRTCIPILSEAFSVLHCALCIIRTYGGFLFIYWFRIQRPKECLYLVTFIVPEFPQTFSSGFFFLSFFHSFIIQQTTIATSFSIPPLSSNSKKKKKIHYGLCQQIALFFLTHFRCWSSPCSTSLARDATDSS